MWGLRKVIRPSLKNLCCRATHAHQFQFDLWDFVMGTTLTEKLRLLTTATALHDLHTLLLAFPISSLFRTDAGISRFTSETSGYVGPPSHIQTENVFSVLCDSWGDIVTDHLVRLFSHSSSDAYPSGPLSISCFIREVVVTTLQTLDNHSLLSAP
jgi:hypothetical protein